MEQMDLLLHIILKAIHKDLVNKKILSKKLGTIVLKDHQRLMVISKTKEAEFLICTRL